MHAPKEEAFHVFTDRLRNGETHRVEGSFAPTFLDVAERELQFRGKVRVRSEVYLADDHLVVCVTASTEAHMPCAVCNEMIGVPLAVDHFYQTTPLSEVSTEYDFSGDVREALLLELPRTIECNGGRCPQRENLAPYLRSQKRSEQTTHFPFAGLDKEQ